MDLTPREIQDKQFHDAFRGYAHEEVDGFLDEVAAAFERVYRENQSLHHRIRELEEQYSQARTTEDMLKRTLLTAQRTADEAIEEARAKAQQMIDSAKARAAELEAAGARKAEEITRQSVSRERELQFRLEGLKHFEREYKARLRAFIESQLRVLDEGPAHPDQIEELARPATTPGLDIQAQPQPHHPHIDESISVAEETPPVVEEAQPVVQRTEEEDFAFRPAHVGAPTKSESAERNDESHMSPIVSFSPSLAPLQEGEAERPPPPSPEEEKSIKELFWGEED